MGARSALCATALITAVAVGAVVSVKSSVAYPRPSPGLPYLLYVSDRDGDEDIYGVRADGGRTVQITRDTTGFHAGDSFVSEDGRWVYVPEQNKAPYKNAFVASTSGRIKRSLAVHFVSSVAFAKDGGLCAYGEDAEWADIQHRASRLMLLSPESGRSRRLGQGDPWSFSPDGAELVALVTQFDRDKNDLNLIDVATGRVRRIAAVPSEGVQGVGWSPTGTRYAFVQGRALRVAEASGTKVRVRTVLGDTRLKDYEPPVRWLDERRLGVVLESDKSPLAEIDVVTVGSPSRRAVLARASEYSPTWSPDGRRVAYTVRRGKQEVDLVVQSSTGSSRHVVAHAAEMSLSWSPNGRLFIEYRNGSHTAIALVDPGHGLKDVWPGGDSISLGAWSPDSAFVTLSYADRGALDVLALSPRARVVRTSIAGNVRILGWVRSEAGPAVANAPAALPGLERISEGRLLAEGKISEVAASGTRVAAIVNESTHDCHHVVAWTAGTSRVIRFDKPRRCEDGANVHGDQASVGIRLEGTRLTWFGEYWGNFVYVTTHTADMRRPRAGIRSSGEDMGQEQGTEPRRPPPERATRRGVSVKVEHGTVILARESDGHLRRITPPGGAVDAELENEGLFYAYNTSGAMKGNVVFIPFAKLFS